MNKNDNTYNLEITQSLMGRFKTITGIVFLIILISIAILKRDTILLAFGNYLIIQDELHTVDVIHVIAGDDFRTEYAVELFKLGYAHKIFFTGGWDDIYDYYSGDHARELAISLGVPDTAIAIDDSYVTSTYSETILLKNWIDQNPIQISSAIIVSDPFHMRRVHWTYRHIFKDELDVLLAPVPFDVTPYQRDWWNNEWARDYVKNEYLKLFYYIARYQLSWGVLNKWLVSLDTK